MIFSNIKHVGMSCLLGISAIFFSESVAMYDNNHTKTAERNLTLITYKNDKSRQVEFILPCSSSRENIGLMFCVPFSLFDAAGDNIDAFFATFPDFVEIQNEAKQYLLDHPEKDSAPESIKRGNRLSELLLKQLGII